MRPIVLTFRDCSLSFMVLVSLVKNKSSFLLKWSASRAMAPKQKFDFFLVMDFEATCKKNADMEPQEIIEFPCLLVSGQSFNIQSQFHRYIKPVHHPILTPFCTELTGITQEMVDHEAHFPEVLKDFNSWFETQVGDKSFTFVTCGDWDLKTMLPNQCTTSGVPVPPQFDAWINIKKAYKMVMGKYPSHLEEMVVGVGSSFEGRQHSGIDDSKNIFKVLKELAQKGHVFTNTFQKEINHD